MLRRIFLKPKSGRFGIAATPNLRNDTPVSAHHDRLERDGGWLRAAGGKQGGNGRGVEIGGGLEVARRIRGVGGVPGTSHVTGTLHAQGLVPAVGFATQRAVDWLAP
jgi:hypothetical protein